MFCVVLAEPECILYHSQAFVWHLWNWWSTLDCGMFWVNQVCNYPKLMVLNRLVCLVSPLHKYLSRWVNTHRSSVSTCDTFGIDGHRLIVVCFECTKYVIPLSWWCWIDWYGRFHLCTSIYRAGCAFVFSWCLLCESFLLGEFFVNSLWHCLESLELNVCVNSLCSVVNPCAGLDMHKGKKVQGKNLWSAC